MNISEDILHIPRFRMELAPETDSIVQATIAKGELASGTALLELEVAFTDQTNRQYALACSNGFSALHLALLALNLEGKKIAMPAISSCMAILNAIRAAKAEPLFVDVEKGSPNISVEALADLNFDAIITPNYFGKQSALQAMSKFDLPIIEDCAQSAGTEFLFNSQSPSHVKIFSFYPTKIINGIDGGMVCTDSQDVFEKAKDFMYYGGKRENDHVQRYNYKMSNVNAAFANAQLKNLEAICKRRIAIADALKEAINEPHQCLYETGHVPQKFILKVANAQDRDGMMEELRNRGIPASTELNPMPAEGLGAFENARDWHARHFSLPCYEALSDEELDYMLFNVREVIK
ncbi:MAG: DegT/DnrJ/EryC1/StrS family aminotransferase [Bacteroidota bacterium]